MELEKDAEAIAEVFTPGSIALKGVLAVCTIGMILGVYLKGRYDANLVCAKAAAISIEKNIKVYGKIKKHSIKMGESELDSALSKWVR